MGCQKSRESNLVQYSNIIVAVMSLSLLVIIKLKASAHRRLITYLVSLFLGTHAVASPISGLEIHNIFIEASGNNEMEAEIKADEMGMKRVLQILADRMNIKNPTFESAGYDDLKKVFKTIALRNEIRTPTNYSATVDYSYDQQGVNDLILRYTPIASDSVSYDYLVIPIFKRRHVITLWDNDEQWLENWDQIRSTLKTHKLLYPYELVKARTHITQENVFTLSYRDFATILPNYLFKRVLLVVAEYFTNSSNGQTYLNIRHIILGDSMKAPASKDYYIVDKKRTPDIFKQSIKDVIKTFSKKEVDIPPQTTTDGDKFYDNDPRMMEFTMYTEIFDAESLKRLSNRLGRIEQIKKFTITRDSEAQHKILIYSTSSIEDLTRGLYLNGLGYVKNEGTYHLIEMTKGI
jgi:hypothetical protein